MKKKQLKIVKLILCLTISAFMMPVEALAMDNPTGGNISVFPVPGNPDTVIKDNYGTINYAKSRGVISYNHYHINHLEGATVGENKSTGIVDEFASGRVENNYGTINKITNTASVGTNTPGGVIKENFNNIDKNMGTIEKQYSGTIKENYGNVGTIGLSATIEKLYEGTITENNGSVVISPAPRGILTVVKIITNKKSVKIEPDTGGKSSVVVDNNESGAVLHVCAGADCTVIDNAGKIEIEEGGVCNIKGKNTGEVVGEPTTPTEEYNYRLILDNVENLSDITFVDFFKKDGNEIYVMDGGSDHNIILSYDTNKYYYPYAVKIMGVMGIKIENTDYSILDDVNQTFTIHFHTIDEYVPTSEGKHKGKCGECAATFNEESCSLIPATCTHKAKCEKCGTEYGSVSPHSYIWVWENGNHKQVCKQCGDIQDIGACSYGEWIIDREAKAGVAGKKHRVCSICKGVENATIPPKPKNGKKKTDNYMKEAFANLEKGRDTLKSEAPAKEEIDRDILKSEEPALTVIASEEATNDFGFFDLKVHKPDGKTTVDQEFLTKNLIGSNVQILLTQNVYPRRDLSTEENGSLKKLTRNSLPKDQAGPVFAVVYNETDGAYVLNGVLDANGTAVFNGFKLRNASTITICK